MQAQETMRSALVDAEPDPIAIDPWATALVIIDMQRDFLEPGGFGETLGNDVSLLAAAIDPCRALLDSARRLNMLVVHTREGHHPDLSDAPRAKLEREILCQMRAGTAYANVHTSQFPGGEIRGQVQLTR